MKATMKASPMQTFLRSAVYAIHRYRLGILRNYSFAPIAFLLVLHASAQTSVDLSRQGRTPDFSAAVVTRPVTVGTTLPAGCIVGQMFFNSAAVAGSNLFGCVAANSWSVIGGVSLTTPLQVANGGTGTSTPSLVAGPNVTIGGNWPNQTISASGNATALQGVAISPKVPTNNQALIYFGSSSSYVPTSTYTLQNGLGTTATGPTNLQVNVSMGIRTVTATTDTILSTDCGGLVTYGNASAVNVSFGTPGLGNNFLTGCPITIRNNGGGVVNLVAQASTIGGNTSQSVSPNKGCLLVSDGSNWQLGNCN